MKNGNNLRDERGALIGGLIVEDYVAGIDDFKHQRPPPDLTTPSYDLGRQRAAQDAEKTAAVAKWLKDDEENRDRKMREILTPEQYAEYRRQIDAIGKSPSR